MTGMVTSRSPVLKAVFMEGLRCFWGSRASWGITALVLLASILSRAAPIPLRDVGFTLQGYSALDQLLASLLFATWILTALPAAPSRSWPVHPVWALGARCLGLAAGSLVFLGLVILAQGVLLWVFGDVSHEESGTPHPAIHLARTWRGAMTYALVLAAWSQCLRVVLRPPMAVFFLLFLVFTGFLLPILQRMAPSLTPLLGIFPDLGVISPVEAPRHPTLESTAHVLYAVAHASAICLLAALLMETSMRRPEQLDSGVDQG